MAVDTVTLELAGTVSLDVLSRSAAHLHSLLSELSRSAADRAQITWIVEDLNGGSAQAVLRGVAADNDTREDQIETVVRAFGQVGQALAQSLPVPYSRMTEVYARRLVDVVDGRVESVRFETPETDAIVSGASSDPDPLHLPIASVGALQPAYGAVEGRIQTMSNRGSLRFTLYDTWFDRAVGCYLPAGYPLDSLREMWGRRAVVEGAVYRDPDTGRPLSVRRVSDIVPQPEGGPQDFLQARGVLPSDGPDGVAIIRQARDG